MQDNKRIYDVIVIGAGIEGSSTAYQLAKQKYNTLLIEQFPLPHNRGSSHGQSRVTRKAYGQQDFYTNMMHESYQLLEQLEREAGEQLFIEAGLLVIGKTDHAYIKDTMTSLTNHRVAFQKYDSTSIKTKFPMFKYPENYVYVLEKGGGVLRADKILNAFQSQFQKYGGVLKDGEAMTEILPGSTVTVRTSRSEYRTKAVVLACGSWADKVLRPLGITAPLQVKRISVCYWKEKSTGSHNSRKFPTFLAATSDGGFDVYGLPSEEYPGMVKLCLHDGPEINPDNRDMPDTKWVLDKIKQYVNDHFPELEPTPSIVEPCIYTMTPDENFIIDRHPKYNNIIIAAGFSGHGFKLAPVIGRVLSHMSTNRNPGYDMTPFRLDRFNSSSKAKL